MSTARDGSNPLRPYYRPPSIGRPQDVPGPTSSVSPGLGPRNGSAASYASSARDMFPDVDYSDYFSDAAPSSMESVQNMLNDGLYKYFSILLSQPFDVAKTILQVRSQGATERPVPSAAQDIDIGSRSSGYRNGGFSDYPDHYGSDSDPDEPAYFTSSAPSPHSYTPTRPRRRQSDRSLSPPSPRQSPPSHQLILKRSDSLLEVISQEWSKEGAWGVWKGSNATFVYSFLLKTLESWSRGVLSALFNVPDPGLVVGLGAAADVVDASYPWSSLGVAIAAAVTAGLVLAPLDLVRTKLILTPTSEAKRSLAYNLHALPSYFCPSPLLMPTILHSIVDPTISHCTPILLRSRLSIDPVLTPNTYDLCRFVSRTLELFIKLPLETVLRRGQMSVLASEEYSTAGNESLRTLVEIGPYRGVIGTMWSIVREEGSPNQETLVGATGKSAKGRKKAGRKGQGVEGLWRGWRVGMWGLVGVCGTRALGGDRNCGGEF